MNLTTLSTIYGWVLHLASIVVIVVLLCTGNIDHITGYSLLAGLLGFAVGVPVTLNNNDSTTPSKSSGVAVSGPQN